MLTLEQILSELEEKTNFSRKQLYDKIKKKHEELSGLVSMEGAAHLVARDLDVVILKPEKRKLKIKDMTDGMKNINFKARVIQISDTRTFERKDGSTGKVCNLILTDGTGEVRLPVWDKQVESMQKELKEGNVIEVKNADIRETAFGMEVRLPITSKIKKIEDDKILPTEPVGRIIKRTSIENTKEGSYELRGNVIHLFDTGPFFRLCPECRKTLEKTEKGYKCEQHSIVKPETNMIISGIMDDGTGSMRVVFFRDQAERVSGEKLDLLSQMSQEEAMSLIKNNVLGNEFVFKGRIKKNKIFDTLELVVNDVEELDIEEESKKVINEIKSLNQGLK